MNMTIQATTSSVAQHLKYIYSVSDLSAVESAINELKDVLLSEDENERYVLSMMMFVMVIVQ